jgi:DNA-nicking Smr family endonuclease
VLVVTGRGLHSEASIPVLKQSVQAWLTHGRPAKQVLGFCSARKEDGGLGAVYVLLRR